MKRYKKNGYFKKRKLPPVSLTYFVQIAWGMSNSFLCKFRKRIEKKEVTVSDTGVNMFVDPDSDEFDNRPVETVLTSMKLATTYFTPQYLYSLNECRPQAGRGPRLRHNSAADRFRSFHTLTSSRL